MAHVRRPRSLGNFLKPYKPVSQSVLAAHLKVQSPQKRVVSCLWLTEGVTAELGRFRLGQRRVLCAFLSTRVYVRIPARLFLTYEASCQVRPREEDLAFSRASRRALSRSVFLAFEFDHAGTRWKVRTEGGRQAGRELRAPTEGSGLGDGGAGHRPIGLERFEWASLEQSRAPPPSSRPKPS